MKSKLEWRGTLIYRVTHTRSFIDWNFFESTLLVWFFIFDMFCITENLTSEFNWVKSSPQFLMTKIRDITFSSWIWFIHIICLLEFNFPHKDTRIEPVKQTPMGRIQPQALKHNISTHQVCKMSPIYWFSMVDHSSFLLIVCELHKSCSVKHSESTIIFYHKSQWIFSFARLIDIEHTKECSNNQLQLV